MVGADYIGNVIKSAQHNCNISAGQLMHLFGCDIKQLHRYEEGVDLIPRATLRRIISYAAMMDMCLKKE